MIVGNKDLACEGFSAASSVRGTSSILVPVLSYFGTSSILISALLVALVSTFRSSFHLHGVLVHSAYH